MQRLMETIREENVKAEETAFRQRADGQGEWLTGYCDGRRQDADAIEKLLHAEKKRGTRLDAD